MRTLAAEGMAVLMVCHDLLVAPLFVDTAVLMAGGRTFAEGPAPGALSADHIAAVFGTHTRITWTDGAAVQATFS